MADTRFSSLDEVRCEIDRLDREMVRLLSARAGCVAAAGSFKSSETEVRAPDRVERMLRERREWAESEALDPSFVEELFRSITSHFIARELRQWRGGADGGGLLISLMLAVPDAPGAAAWYREALGARELWNLGSVIGLEVSGAPFFIAEPANNGWESPDRLGMPSARVEVFCGDPDAFVTRAIAAGAKERGDPVRVHSTPWGPHRQGGFVDPFGHIWLVGDRTPLSEHRG
jgi:chorismate mutase-like protein